MCSAAFGCGRRVVGNFSEITSVVTAGGKKRGRSYLACSAASYVGVEVGDGMASGAASYVGIEVGDGMASGAASYVGV